MQRSFRHHICGVSRIIWFALALAPVPPAPAEMATRKSDPYVGAIVVDAQSGDVLVEDNADAMAYPASVLKLMDLLLIFETVQQGALRLEDEVHADAEATKMGGSQVYLAEHEVFTVDDLLYALIVQSANDAAVALAKRVAGTKEGFVKLMNEKAVALGMTRTRFHSVHGLPPGAGQAPDVSTPRDMAILGRELLRHPEALRYTSTQERGFRNGEFIMRTHNPLLKTFPGCDGLKTGYYGAAGFSIAATAEREGARIIAVVLGSESKQVRNAKAAELLSRGFLKAAKRKAATE